MKHWQSNTAGLTVVLLMTLGAVLWFGSVNRAIAVLSGHPLCVEPRNAAVSLDSAGNGEQFLLVTNLSKTRLRILGIRLPCTCMTASELPIDILPGVSTSIRVQIRNPKRLKQYYVNILTDCPSAPVVCVVLSGV